MAYNTRSSNLYPTKELENIKKDENMEGEESARNVNHSNSNQSDSETDNEDLSAQATDNERREINSSRRTATEKQNYNWIYFIVGIILVGVSIFMACWPVTVNDSPEVLMKESSEDFSNNMKLIQQKHKKQDKRMWPMIKSSVKSVLNSSNPLGPSVVLLLNSEKSIMTSHELSKELANITARAFHVKYDSNTTEDYESYYCAQLATYSSDEAKLHLDNILNNAFHTKHVTLLFDIEKLPDDSSIILHSYCDNTNAPFKNVVFYLTVTCESTFFESNKPWGEIGENCMKHYLSGRKGLNEDKIAALLSRIANSVVVIVIEE